MRMGKSLCRRYLESVKITPVLDEGKVKIRVLPEEKKGQESGDCKYTDL